MLNPRRGIPAADFCVSVRPGADAKKGWGTDEKNGKFRRKRDLPQALAAQGLTGGMSESALAGMYNSYGNNRNTIDRGRNESLAALLDTLNSNRSSALQSYNSQLSAAEQQKMAYQMQLEQALANGSAEILQNKYDTLQNLDNAYAQQILALQQAAAQAAQKRW